MKKWSLIVFTILAQMAVGAFWVLLSSRQYFITLNSAQTDIIVLSPLMVIETIIVLSLLISLAKLGSPLIAYRAITNLRSSWLSREILFALLFTLASLAFTYLIWAQIGSLGMRSVVAWMAAIFGFLLIYSMSRLYMLRTVPVWNTIFTPLSFFLAALILGGLVVGTLFAVRGGGPTLEANLLSIITKAALYLLVGEFLLVIGRVIRFFSASSKETETIQRLINNYRNLVYYRLLLGVAGLICLIIIFLQTSYAPGLYAICFLLILIAELADRFLFYTAREFSGI